MKFSEWKLSLVEGKNVCYWCHKKGNDRGRNNFHYYGEGNGGFCFACNNKLVSDEYKTVEEVEEEWDLSNEVEFNRETYDNIVENTSPNGKGYRGLDSKLLAKTGVRYGFDTETGEVSEVYYPITEGTYSEGLRGFEALKGYKIRKLPKKFHSIGDVGSQSEFFLQHLYPTHKGWLLIVEGENDALAATQMLAKNNRDNKFDEVAVVSPVTGSGGIVNAIRANYEWVDQFKRIIVCMDNDHAGKLATEKAMEILPKGKSYVVNMRRLDVHEFLEENDAKGFLNDFWGMKLYTPEDVTASSELFAAIIEESGRKSLSLPPFMHRLERVLGKMVVGEIHAAFGDTGIGKSTFVDSIIEHWIVNEPERTVGVMSLEAARGKYATNLLSKHLGVNLNKMEGKDRIEYLSQPDVKEKVDNFFMKEDGSARFFIYESRGTSVEATKKSVYEMIKRLEVDTLLIDPASDLTTHLTREQTDEFFIWLKELTLEFPDILILLSLHTRKRDTNIPATENDVIGSSIAIKSCAQTFSIERKKLHDDPIVRNTTTFTVHKNRPHQTTGVAGKAYYDLETGRLYDLEDFLEDNPHYKKTNWGG